MENHVYGCERPLSLSSQNERHIPLQPFVQTFDIIVKNEAKKVCVCKCVTTWNRLERNGDTVVTVAPAANSKWTAILNA